MTLDELVSGGIEDLALGEHDIDGNFCKHCKSLDLFVSVRLEATVGSLAGMQLKTSARKVGVLCCRGCGRESGS